ncbi:MAG TPA: DUF1549 domain-containing protein [Gemmataceae bacterium]|nr:DUF1549 domain-containing protein [Gemmataceae bacterium]
MRILRLLLTLLASGFVPSLSRADNLLPPTLPLEQVVDHYVDARLKEEGITPAPPADDATFLRRVTLDLTGRIPTLDETRTFTASTSSNKRVELVERLMNSPGFVRHQATEFDTMLMNGTRGSVRPYLLTALGENRSWDRIYRDLMLPDESDPKQKPAAELLRQRVRDLDKLTAEVSSIFFGVNVSCARCHDHPLVADWKQDHFFGMKSFFSRTYESRGQLAERETGLVKFKTTKGVERQARLMFLTGKVIETNTLKETPGDKAKKRRKKEKDNSGPPPAPPKFSARAELVKVSLQPSQRAFFARSIVNRVWHRLFGYGLVMPLDQMHSANDPSHPDLLDWLARDVIEHQYDLRRLIRGLVFSRAYARDSRWEKGNAPRPQLFAVARVKPLTPMQLAVSLRLAVTDPQQVAATLKPEEFDKRLQGLESSAGGIARLFDQPGDDFQVGVSEALLFSNGDRIQKDLLTDGGDRLLGRLKQLKNGDEVIDLTVRTIFCRPPRDEERKLLADYLKQRADRPAEALRQMVWALLTSAEFRFNY